MTLPPRWRKLVLTAHVVSSVGSLGAVAVFLVFAVIGLASPHVPTVRAVYVANGLIAGYVILPSILASLLIGIVQALGTPWGLFRHYWVLVKFLLTVATVGILLQQMGGIDYAARLAAETTLSGADILELRYSFRLHAGGGLLVLIVLVALSVYKPRGLTRYGWRKQHEEA